MKQAFLFISGILTVLYVVPYIRDILRRTTKPNIVTWITWTILTAIATAAEFTAGEYRTAIYTAISTLSTLSIVIFGLRYGYARYSRFDIICQVGALSGIIIWQLFNSPTLGLIATVMIDFIGALPTYRHSWYQPQEETWQTYALSAAGAAFAILALTSYNFVSLSFAVYILISDIAISLIIISRLRTRLIHELPQESGL